MRLAREHINRLLADGKQVKILCVGKKGFDQLRRLYAPLIIETIDFRGVRQLAFEHAERVSDKVLALFAEGAFDVRHAVLLALPLGDQPDPDRAADHPGHHPRRTRRPRTTLGGAVYEYEPDEADILTELLPLNITTQIFKALLENAASEQGARMSAMDNATRNAGDMIGRLTLKYNRTRQAMITKELIEIISGAEAL